MCCSYIYVQCSCAAVASFTELLNNRLQNLLRYLNRKCTENLGVCTELAVVLRVTLLLIKIKEVSNLFKRKLLVLVHICGDKKIIIGQFIRTLVHTNVKKGALKVCCLGGCCLGVIRGPRVVRWGKIVGLVHRVFLLGCPLGWLLWCPLGGPLEEVNLI